MSAAPGADALQEHRPRPGTPEAGTPEAGKLGNERRYINRELSWLEFNRRVLALAEAPEQPLLEKAKFLAIFSSNLDEFFQVRVAGLKDQLAAGLSGTAPDGLSVPDQLRAIRCRGRRDARATSADLQRCRRA